MARREDAGRQDSLGGFPVVEDSGPYACVAEYGNREFSGALHVVDASNTAKPERAAQVPCNDRSLHGCGWAGQSRHLQATV